MAESLILGRIKERYDSLTGAQRQIADFMAAHIDDVAFMTIDEVAAAARVSPATVARFSVELGYSGFAAMNADIQQYVKRYLGPLRGAVRNPVPASGPAAAFQAALQQDRDILAWMASRTDAQVLEEVVGRLLQARRVWVAGNRTLAGVASFFAWALHVILGNVHLLREAEGRLPEQALDMEPADVLVAFSYPRYYRGTLAVARWAAEHGVTLVVVTDSVLSPPARLTPLVLTTPYRSLNVPGTTPIGALALSDGLLHAVTAALTPEQKDRLVARIERLESIQSAWSIWDFPPPEGSS